MIKTFVTSLVIVSAKAVSLEQWPFFDNDDFGGITTGYPPDIQGPESFSIFDPPGFEENIFHAPDGGIHIMDPGVSHY